MNHNVLRAGHDPLILEARSGSGVVCRRCASLSRPGLYAEAGAMRIPRAHTLTVGELNLDPESLDYDIAEHEVGKTIHDMWAEALRPIVKRLEAGGDAAWPHSPFPLLRHVEVLKLFTRAKQRAIRQLHYGASAKIFLQCRRRFWEEDDGISGGGTVTDLLVRNIYYPEHARERPGGGWWPAHVVGDSRDIRGRRLKDVAPRRVRGRGVCAVRPGQQTLLYPHIVAPEGRIHFAGEHASLTHARIQGAIRVWAPGGR